MQVAVELLEYLQSGAWQGAIVFLRVAATASLLPAFGEQTIPMRLRLVIGVAFSVIVAPAVPPLETPAGPAEFAALAVSETAIGLALGIMVRMFVFTLQIAGSIAAQATSLSQLLGGSVSEPVPAMGHLLVTGGLALAVMFGLHIRAAELMIGSYEVFPPGDILPAGALSEWGVARISYAFSLAFGLATPFVIAALVYNLTLGVINRAMPQLMVAFVGAPVITAGGLLLLMLGAPLILAVWVEAMQGFFDNPLDLTP